MLEYCGGFLDSDTAREKFDQLDINGNSYLVLSDMSRILNGRGWLIWNLWLQEVLFWSIDARTNDGRVDLHEFVQYCKMIQARNELKIQKRSDRKAKAMSTY
jgi:Ca2+-binding EF-hand superfamily protein